MGPPSRFDKSVKNGKNSQKVAKTAKNNSIAYNLLHFLPFMSSILLSIFWANATSWGVGGPPSGLFLLILREAAA
jgi:hypothetical protein